MDLNHTETQRVIRVLYVADLHHWCVNFVVAKQIRNPKKFKTWAKHMVELALNINFHLKESLL